MWNFRNIQMSLSIFLMISVAWLPAVWSSADSNSTSCDDISIFNDVQTCVPNNLGDLFRGFPILRLGKGNQITFELTIPDVCNAVKATFKCLAPKVQSCDIDADDKNKLIENILPHLPALKTMCKASSCPSESDLGECLKLLPLIHAEYNKSETIMHCKKLNDANQCLLGLTNCDFDEVPQISNFLNSWNKENNISQDAHFLCPEVSRVAFTDRRDKVPARYCEATLMRYDQPTRPKCGFGYTWKEDNPHVYRGSVCAGHCGHYKTESSTCPSVTEVRQCLQLLPLKSDSASRLTSQGFCPMLRIADACLNLKKCNVDEASKIVNAVKSWNIENKISKNDAYFFCSDDGRPHSGEMTNGETIAWYCETRVLPQLECSLSYIWNTEGEPSYSVKSGTDHPVSCYEPTIYNFSSSSCVSCPDRHLRKDMFQCIFDKNSEPIRETVVVVDNGASISVHTTSVLMVTSVMWTVMLKY